jgi:UDP-N-acetylglucosamine 1-carboxyvinyltransferase
MGVSLSIEGAQMRVRREGSLRPVDFSALPYPGIPTDMQPQLLALLSLADGTSVVTDAVHPERFAHVAELNKMGAHIVRQGAQAIVRGPAHLSGASIAAQDLRGGAALILAALAAEGVTRLSGIEHVDRGYERIEWRLSALGTDIIRVGAPAESAASREQLRRAAS